MADSNDVIILLLVAFVIGLLVGKGGGAVPAQAPVEMSNLETWDMNELPDGTIRVVVHRKVKRG